MSYVMVTKWWRASLEGRENVHNEQRSGRPSLAKDDKKVLAVQNVVKNVPLMTFLNDRLPVSKFGEQLW